MSQGLFSPPHLTWLRLRRESKGHLFRGTETWEILCSPSPALSKGGSNGWGETLIRSESQRETLRLLSLCRLCRELQRSRSSPWLMGGLPGMQLLLSHLFCLQSNPSPTFISNRIKSHWLTKLTCCSHCFGLSRVPFLR